MKSESAVLSSFATVQKGVAKADGNLKLDTQFLTFEPLNKSMGLGSYRVERSTIKFVRKCSGKGAGILPITADGFQVQLVDGSELEFIVVKPEAWVKEIEKELSAVE